MTKRMVAIAMVISAMIPMTVIPAAVLGMLLTVPSHAVEPPAENASNTVRIDNFSFAPATLTVAAGTTVTWINHDDMPHTVASDARPRIFNSPPMDTDEKFAYRFDKAGTYTYFCSMHPRMTGTIVVK